MYNHMIKTIFIFVENWILYDTIQDFSAWLRTGVMQWIIIGFKAIYKIIHYLLKAGLASVDKLSSK